MTNWRWMMILAAPGLALACTDVPINLFGGTADEGSESDTSGDGDPSTGDGDGDSMTGDGDGDGDGLGACGDGVVDPDEVCDDNNLDNGDACNPTCNLSNQSELFVGAPGLPGRADGIGEAARIGGYGALAVDGQFLWFADGSNNVVSRIDIETAQLEMIAGDRVGGSAGDLDAPLGADARFFELESIEAFGGYVYVTDNGNRKIKRIQHTAEFPVVTVAGSGAQGVDDGVGAAVSFDDPRGLTYEGGYIYLLDGAASVLRRYDPATHEVVTLAGSAYTPGLVDGVGSEARFISPRYMSSDGEGHLFIAEPDGYAIRVYDVASTAVSTLAGDGVQTYVDEVGASAGIHRPRGLSFDGVSVYLAEFDQHTIRQLVVETASVSTLIGQHCEGQEPCAGDYVEGVGAAARFDAPFDLDWHGPSNSLFVVDSGNAVIRRVF